MIIIPVPQKNRGRQVTRRQTFAGFLVAAFIALGFALFVALIGPETGPPPPAFVKWVIIGIAVILAFVGFFTWLRSAGEGDDAGQDNNSNEES
jgi:drug/metabolite transporter (DMT)-like permease